MCVCVCMRKLTLCFSITVVPQWFVKYRASATGFAALGSGLGNLLYAMLGQVLIDLYGWRNALRILGGVGGCLLFFAFLLLRRRMPLQNTSFFTTPRELIKLRNYRAFLAATFCFNFGFFVPFVHLNAYTRDLGYSKEEAAFAVALLGIGSSVGRISMGPFADWLGRLAMFRVCMFLSALVMALWPVSTSLPQIYCYAFFYTFLSGGYISLSPVVAADLWGAQRLGGVFSLVNLVTIVPALTSSPLAGLVYEQTKSYNLAIWPAAAFLFSSGVFLLYMTKENVNSSMASNSLKGKKSNGEDGEGDGEYDANVDKNKNMDNNSLVPLTTLEISSVENPRFGRSVSNGSVGKA